MCFTAAGMISMLSNAFFCLVESCPIGNPDNDSGGKNLAGRKHALVKNVIWNCPEEIDAISGRMCPYEGGFCGKGR